MTILLQKDILAGCCVVGYGLGLFYVTPGGQIMLEMVDYYGGTILILALASCEIIAFNWIYGTSFIGRGRVPLSKYFYSPKYFHILKTNIFSEWYIAPLPVRDLNFMLETQLSLYWRLCWSLVCPLLLPLLFFYVLFTQSGVPNIPVPAQLAGWILASIGQITVTQSLSNSALQLRYCWL